MIPHEILICGEKWKIIFSEHMNADDSEGECYKILREIHLATGRSSDSTNSTLIHEILHAILDIGGIQGDEKLDEEAICCRLSTLLYYVIRDNPELCNHFSESSGQ